MHDLPAERGKKDAMAGGFLLSGRLQIGIGTFGVGPAMVGVSSGRPRQSFQTGRRTRYSSAFDLGLGFLRFRHSLSFLTKAQSFGL